MGKKHPNPREPAERLDKVNQKNTDEQIIEALVEARGMVAVAARRLGVSVRSIYYRMEQSPEIAQAKNESREINKDLAESALLRAIEKGEAWAVCFFLKCQAKDRGYIERSELEITADVNHSGEVTIRDLANELEADPEWTKFARNGEADRFSRLLRHERQPADGVTGHDPQAGQVEPGQASGTD